MTSYNPYSERSLNKGLDLSEEWRLKAKNIPQENEGAAAAIRDLTIKMSTAISTVITKPNTEDGDASFIFLCANGREMFNYQKQDFFRIVEKLSNKEIGDLIMIYRAQIERDPNQVRISKLIPELAALLNNRIDEEKEARRDAERAKETKAGRRKGPAQLGATDQKRKAG